MHATPPMSADPAFRRERLSRAWLADETTVLQDLIPLARWPDAAAAERVRARATRLVEAVRARRLSHGGLDAFLHEYDLSSQEGVVLLCLAEALLRIPDAGTADRLIQDKLVRADWRRHLGPEHSLLVNAGTWGLMLTGRIVRLEEEAHRDPWSLLGRLAARIGEPAIRAALRQAMRIVAHQFVMGRDLPEALERSDREENRQWRYSFDMLGEAALTAADAETYFQAYAGAIEALAERVAVEAPGRLRLPSETIPETMPETMPGVSVKLSALHPRCEAFQHRRLMAELVPRLRTLARQARAAGIGLTIDAEEADRLDVTLEVFEAVYRSAELEGWTGLGLAVQAYQKRALAVIEWLAALAAEVGRRIPLRLVKGAYWDMEIKRAQERGLDGYPVFTRKVATDVSYLACARRIFELNDRLGGVFHPQFATHNAHTVAAVLELAQGRPFEFQRLHGMGEPLYLALRELPEGADVPCRVYAPVGSHEVLLPYLVRRLLENGANTSFVNRVVDERVPVAEVVADPVERLQRTGCRPHPAIPLPRELYRCQYGEPRQNARGFNLHDPPVWQSLRRDMDRALEGRWHAGPVVGGVTLGGVAREIRDPACRERRVGVVEEAEPALVEQAVTVARQAFAGWDGQAVEARAACLERAADLLESQAAPLLALCVREGGRTVADAVAELREAVDYCRYYAMQARRLFAEPCRLPGPSGERNTLRLRGRGVFACISPWNFPLALFTGQVAAALAAGNTVVAKPAHQTPLVAARVVSLLHEAGIPGEVLHFLPGSGPEVGEVLVRDPRLAGVAFTGSTATAWRIVRLLAQRRAPLAALIAETGGLNCMIVDSSALPEQVAADALQSAFNSAGQRCSALRVLFLQEEIAPRVIELLQGALLELRLGDPLERDTDIGPLIDEQARERLAPHVARMEAEARLLAEGLPPAGESADAWQGCYFTPRIYEIDRLDRLRDEVFGPILHVVRYAAGHLDRVIEAVNASGYGLALGIHSRIEKTAEYIRSRVRVGNVYVNRNMIGAVVGVQPFGGEGLSGTGPKAGGPHYLLRFATEQTYTVNTAALGGNPELLALQELCEE